MFRIRNGGLRPLGAITYDMRYYDEAGRLLAIETNSGTSPHDHSSHVGLLPPVLPSAREIEDAQVIEPGETQEVFFTPNYGPIPTTAVRAEVDLETACELVRPRPGGIGFGDCWWSRPSATAPSHASSQ